MRYRLPPSTITPSTRHPHPPRLLQPSMRSHIDARIATTPRLPDPPATRDARRYRASSTLPQASQSAAGRQVPRRTTQAQRQRAMRSAPPSSSAPPILIARPPLASHRRSRAAGAGQMSRPAAHSQGGGSAGVRSASPRPSGVRSSGAPRDAARSNAMGRGAVDTLRARDMLHPPSLPRSKRAPCALSPLRDAGLARVPAMSPTLIVFILLI